MVLDMKIKEDNPGSDYTITINDDKIIHTTIASTSDGTLNQWLQEMHRLHCRNTKDNNNNLIVFLSAAMLDPSGFMDFFPLYKPDQVPDMLKFCVGSYCILVDVKKDETLDAPLVGFISSPKITLVGFQIRNLVDRLGFMMKVEKTLDLNELFRKARGLSKYYRFINWGERWQWYWYQLEKLGRLILADEISFKEEMKVYWRNPPDKLKFWEEEGAGNNCCKKIYSLDNIKVSTVEVYLCHRFAVKFREIVSKKKISLDYDNSY